MNVCMDDIYRDCKEVGLKAVARRLGLEPTQLVDALHRAGVAAAKGCPSQREIAERCRDVRRSWKTGRSLD
jgi:hypothetical protein